MFRTLNVVILISLILFQTLLAPAAFAGTIKYKVKNNSNSGLLTGDAETKSVGKLKLGGDSKVVVTNNVVDILFANADLTTKESSDESKKLSGTVFCVKTKNSGIRTKIKGYAFFEKGKALADLNVPGSQDTVTLKDGTVYIGKITRVEGNELYIKTESGTQTIRTSSIDNVSSPLVSKFEISVRPDGAIAEDGSFTGTSKKISFKSTYSGRVKTASGTGAKTKTPMTKKTEDCPCLCCWIDCCSSYCNTISSGNTTCIKKKIHPCNIYSYGSTGDGSCTGCRARSLNCDYMFTVTISDLPSL